MKTLTALAIAATLTLSAWAGPKLTGKDASAIALKKVPGQVRSVKYENEEGHWQYAVLIEAKSHQLYEIQIDPTSGKILDVEKTTPAEEQKEK